MVEWITLRTATIAGILVLCTVIAVYAEIILHTSIVYTHFFYIPILLAGLWYRRIAVAVALYLGAVHIITQYLATHVIEIPVIVRAVSFVVVALIVIVINNNMRSDDRMMLDYITSYSKRITPVQARFGGTFDGIRIVFGLNMDIERMRTTGDVGGLVRTLSHQKPEVRYQAAEALGLLRDPHSVEALFSALQDPDGGVKWRAAEALGFIGQPAVQALSWAVQHGDDEMRWRAILALGETRDPSALQVLISALGDADYYVQDRAVIALERFGEQAIEPLHSAMSNEDMTIRNGAARALGYMGRLSSVMILVDALDSHDEITQKVVRKGLFETADRVVGPLATLLRDENPNLRKGAARALGVLRNPKAMMVLQRATVDPDPAVRVTVAESLASVASAGHRNSGEEK